MSAFLMVAAVPPKTKTNRKPPNRQPSMESIRSGIQSSNQSTFTMGNYMSSRKSAFGPESVHGTPSLISGDKKVFDINTSRYVEYKTMLSLFEQKLLSFNEEVARVKSSLSDQALPLMINEAVCSGDSRGLQVPLYTPQNLRMLQYNYFEAFETSERVVEKKTQKQRPAYAQIIEADEKMESLFSSGKDSHLKGSVATDASRGKIRALERRLACVPVPSMEHTSCVRDAFHQASFWSDVYHDIKFESLENDYYGWLPPQEVTQKLFIELMDFALYRLRCVRCELSKEERQALNADEVHELDKNNFYYFQQHDISLMECLHRYLNAQFLGHMKSQAAVAAELSQLRRLMDVVLECICNNLKLNYYGHTSVETVTGTFYDFMHSIFELVFIADEASRPSGHSSSLLTSESEGASISGSSVDKTEHSESKGSASSRTDVKSLLSNGRKKFWQKLRK